MGPAARGKGKFAVIPKYLSNNKLRKHTADIFIGTTKQCSCQENGTVTLIPVAIEQQRQKGTTQSPYDTEGPVDHTAAAHPDTGCDTAEDRLCDIT